MFAIKKPFTKTVVHSLNTILLVTAIALVIGFIYTGGFNPAFIFPLNFLVGAGIIATGLLVLAIPTFLLGKKHRGIDHTNYAERVLAVRQSKRKKSNEIILFGMLNIFFTGAIQMILSFLI